MADRKSFLLRVDRDTLDAVQRWANNDLRSLNGQIEFLLRRALQQNGRVTKSSISTDTSKSALGNANDHDHDQSGDVPESVSDD